MLQQNDLHIQLSKAILKLGANEAYIYSILSKNSLLDGGAIVHLPQLAEMLGISNRTENRDKIKESLANLQSNLGIEFYTDFQFKKNLNLLELKGSQYFYARVPSVENNFVKMSLEDFNKLVYFDEKEYKQMIMFQYLYIVGMVNEGRKERKISYPTIEQIAEKTGFDRKTVIRYNQILTKYKLIYIDTVTINDKSKNIYARWNDKKDVLEAVAEAKESGYISKVKKEQKEKVFEAKKEVAAKSNKQKRDNSSFDPSIEVALKGFIESGLAMHKGTQSKIKEAIQICGEDQLIIVVKELEHTCRNNGIPESRWAGYFSNNIISKANGRKRQVDAQKRANEISGKQWEKEQRQRVKLSPYKTEWQREGYTSRKEYEKAQKEAKKEDDTEDLLSTILYPEWQRKGYKSPGEYLKASMNL
ncbi:hypothetical protein P5491_012875 [Priestia megaterium]|uniref:Replication protein n=1 Tax=Priestia megaterium TaxID=1404 RepID=A0ABD4X008_PRIMG|nr:hypothetical protein [Priestia megaterium]MDD9785880.1 hypothetical protein [Priestia megaterium]MDH3141981.1 hypothetical protein [Priestia megaterium]